MKLSHSISYDATAADVFAMLADPQFRQLSAEAMGVLSAEVDVQPATGDGGGGMVVTIDQVQPTTGVPGFAKKFAGETTRAVQHESWESPTHATITIETPGKPTSIRGTLDLAEHGGVTTETMTAEVKVKVPLIGGRLESLMVDLVEQGMDAEREAGVAWLKEKRG